MRFIIRLYKMIRKIVIHNLLSIYVSLLIGAMRFLTHGALRFLIRGERNMRKRMMCHTPFAHTPLGLLAVCTTNPLNKTTPPQPINTQSEKQKLQHYAEEWYKKNALSLTQKHGEHGHSSLHHRLYPKKK